MSKTLDQIFLTNPITSNASTDLMYFSRSPYTPGNDVAMTYSNFASQLTTSVEGTVNQVLVNGSTNPQVGNVLLTLPQNINPNTAFQVNSLQFNTGTGLLDNDGLELLTVQGIALAVNNFHMQNNSTGFSPILSVEGSDPNVDFNVLTKGTGQYIVKSANTTTAIKYLTGTSYQHTSLFSFPNTAASQTYTWPDASGTVALTNNVLQWNDVSGTSQSAVANNGYIISNSSQTTINIPATVTEGSTFAVAGKGAAGWIIQMNTGQTLHYGNVASTVAGTATSNNQYDSMTILCVTANTTFVTIASQGNISMA